MHDHCKDDKYIYKTDPELIGQKIEKKSNLVIETGV